MLESYVPLKFTGKFDFRKLKLFRNLRHICQLWSLNEQKVFLKIKCLPTVRCKLKIHTKHKVTSIFFFFRLRLLWSGVYQLFNLSLLCGQWRISHIAPCRQCHSDITVLWVKGHTSGGGMLQRDWLWPPTTCVCWPAHTRAVDTGVCFVMCVTSKWTTLLMMVKSSLFFIPCCICLDVHYRWRTLKHTSIKF